VEYRLLEDDLEFDRVGGFASSGVKARLIRGFSWSLVGTVFNQGSTFLVNAILANHWGLDSFGQYAIVLTTVTAAVQVAQLAAGYTATRYTAEFRQSDPARAGRVLGLCGSVAAVTGALVSAAMVIGANGLAAAVAAPELALPLRIGALTLFPAVVNGFMTGALAGFEGYRSLGRAGVISGSLYLVFGATGGWFWGAVGAFAGIALSAAVQFLILRRAVYEEAARQHVRIDWAGGRRETHVLSKFAIPAALNGLLYLPAIWLTNAMLAADPAGFRQIALFTAANSFRMMALFVPSIMTSVGMSVLNNQRGAEDEGRYRRVFWTNVVTTGSIVVGAAGIIGIFGPWLLELFGKDFRGGYAILLILLSAAIPEVLTHATLQPIKTQERVWLVFAGSILPCYLTILTLAAIWIPKAGAVGLAWAYASGWTVALIGSICLVARFGIWNRAQSSAAPPG
jgi:O-antigen/teichoic acid export membrane protein